LTSSVSSSCFILEISLPPVHYWELGQGLCSLPYPQYYRTCYRDR
jgi:hypothetical protein